MGSLYASDPRCALRKGHQIERKDLLTRSWLRHRCGNGIPRKIFYILIRRCDCHLIALWPHLLKGMQTMLHRASSIILALLTHEIFGIPVEETLLAPVVHDTWVLVFRIADVAESYVISFFDGTTHSEEAHFGWRDVEDFGVHEFSTFWR